MAEDPKQVDKDDGQGRAAVHNKWVSWTIAFLCILLVIVVALLVATALFDPFDALKSAWRWYFRSEPNPSITERKDLVLGAASIVQAFAVLVAGVVALAGLYFTRRTLLHNQETLRINQEDTQRTLALTEQGQLTERFTRAIDQLGATDDKGEMKLEIRLGGIYALERIDKESPERAYHSTVMEVLTAYVRENAAWPPKSSNKAPEEGFMLANAENGRPAVNRANRRIPILMGVLAKFITRSHEAAEQDEGIEQGVEPTSGTPRTDIQAILDILNRREEYRVHEKHRVQNLDLRGTDLRGANLDEAPLARANLDGAKLEEATLIEASLERAKLGKANLKRAKLGEANLKRARLIKANLERAKLGEANLKKARLGGANLEEANLYRANLKEANLGGANLEGASLGAANLEGAIGLTWKQIERAFGDEKTALPKDLVDHRPRAWSKTVGEQRKILQERLERESKDEQLHRHG